MEWSTYLGEVEGDANTGAPETAIGTFTVKSGLAQMAKGGVVMDVTNAEQARIAEEAGVANIAKYIKY